MLFGADAGKLLFEPRFADFGPQPGGFIAVYDFIAADGAVKKETDNQFHFAAEAFIGRGFDRNAADGSVASGGKQNQTFFAVSRVDICFFLKRIIVKTAVDNFGNSFQFFGFSGFFYRFAGYGIDPG